jgi:release factor glutamine methyltransferase
VDLSKVFRERFNLIVANPPYVGIEEFQALESQIKDYEPYWALTDGADGLEFYRRMSPLMPDLLSENGAVFFEVTPNRAKQVEAILKGVLSDFAIIQDYAGLPRVAGGRCSLK